MDDALVMLVRLAYSHTSPLKLVNELKCCYNIIISISADILVCFFKLLNNVSNYHYYLPSCFVNEGGGGEREMSLKKMKKKKPPRTERRRCPTEKQNNCNSTNLSARPLYIRMT